jgi:GTP-dependent phosphoenolpyruvate carboxykinase
MTRLLAIDPAEWTATLDQVRGHFARFGDKLPPEFTRMLNAFEERLAG